jgi:hypothetical protein
LDADHYTFHNLLISSDPTQPAVEIEDGVNITTMNFDGYQAWVNAGWGLKWISTTTSGVSQQLALNNVRYEQGTLTTGYFVEINANTNLQGFLMSNCSGGLDTNGIKLRNIQNAKIVNTYLLNTSLVTLDVDNTVQPLILDNCFFQQGTGTVSVGTLKKSIDYGRSDNGGLIPSYVMYKNPSFTDPIVSDFPIMGSPVTLLTTETAVIGPAATTMGFVFVTTSQNTGAMYFLNGATDAVVESNDPNGFFSVTKGAVSYNIYYEAANDSYVIENGTASTRSVSWYMVGGLKPA